MPSRTRADRGVTLLEAMISMSVLLVGMLGLAQLQIWGVSSNQGARAHTQAIEIARELVSGLERLAPQDVLLAPHFRTPGVPPPEFGRRLQPDGSVTATGFTAWEDTFLASAGGLVTGVRPSTAMPRDTLDNAAPAFDRRWSVWEVQTASTESAMKLVAVSVVYREKAFPAPREVVLYAQIVNTGATIANANAYR